MTTPSSSVDLSVAKKSKVSPSKDELKKIIEKQKSEIKTLKQTIRRKEKKITCLSGVLSDLKEKSLINQSTASLLEEKLSGLTLEVIKNQLKNQDRGSQGRRYDEEVKKFALTLNFYSPRAYEYIRGVFSLPHSNSLTEWTSSVECEPGIFMDVLKNLNSRIKENPTHADCVLICDAMSIKSSVFYNPTTGNHQGYIDYGDGIEVPDVDIAATEATVFMLVSFRGHWKYPIGYVLDNKLNAQDLRCLLSRALYLCSENSIKIRCITMDGTSTNLGAMKLFGCGFGNTLDEIDGSFVHEAYNYTIYFIADPVHMLKLARNSLGELKVFTDSCGRKIEWKFIELLHNEQQKLGLKFGNSLSTRHIEYKKNKMNVKIACQTLSASVADSIEFLMQSGNSDFKNAEGTIEFIRTIDKLFDLLNVRNPFGKGYKQALRLSNRVVWEETIVASVRYLYNLKTSDGTPLLKHRRKTFVVGFITSQLSTKMLAIELMKSNDFQYLLTYKFS